MDAAARGGSAAEPPAAAPATVGFRSTLTPFRHPAFAVLWTATVVSNVGTWMYTVAVAWLMTSLAPSPLMVALVQTASTLPTLLFALPAGALADIFDRRRLLLAVQAGLTVAAAALAALVALDLATPLGLLVFTFLIGVGAALTAPPWQAIVPQLVPRADLQPAVALNSIGFNISRAIGPALAGLLIATAGIAAPFFVNAASFLAVVAALAWWRPAPAPPRRLPPERFLGAVRTGVRYVRESGPLRATLARALGFVGFTSAYWALLPLIARQELGGGPTLYGVLLGCAGFGAVAGAFALPRLRAALGVDRLVDLGTLGSGVVLVVLALVPSPSAAGAASLLAGACWIAVVASLGTSVQVALPDWVRARGLSVYVALFSGSMSIGSALWGQAAELAGIPAALLAAALGAAVVVPLTRRWKLLQGLALDLEPSAHWTAPVVARAVEPDRGPVMVTVEYRIDPAGGTAEGFLAAVHELGHERRRDGAFAWGIFEDVAAPGRYLEYFMVESWVEHLRQHERVTRADRMLEERVLAFHLGPGEPAVTHLVGAGPPPVAPGGRRRPATGRGGGTPGRS